MKFLSGLSAALGAVMLICATTPATADSVDAMCEVRKDGDKRKGASGPCDFSQRQGYVDLKLRNGDDYSLRPTDKANHYKDQHGNKVVLKNAQGNSQEYKWEGGKKIIVTFDSGPSAQPVSGGTAADLSDLVGAKAGQAEGELNRRGYQYAKGTTSGDTKYGAWFNKSTGRCVMVRTEQGRYRSIVNAPASDCGR